MPLRGWHAALTDMLERIDRTHGLLIPPETDLRIAIFLSVCATTSGCAGQTSASSMQVAQLPDWLPIP